MLARSLMVAFGFDVDGTSVEEADRALAMVKKAAIAATVALGAIKLVKIGAAVVGEIKELGVEVGTTAKKLGVTTDALQELRYVAQSAGASTKSMDDALLKLRESATKSVTGTKSLAKRFRLLGINVKDSAGHIKGSDHLLWELTGALKGVEDSSKRAAIAQQLMGTAGLDLNQVLDMGQEKMTATQREAHRLGVVMSGSLIRDSEAVTANQKKLAGSLFKLKIIIASKVMPVLVRFTDWLVEFANNSGKSFVEALESAGDVMGVVWGYLEEGIKKVKDFAEGFDIDIVKTTLAAIAIAIGVIVAVFAVMAAKFVIGFALAAAGAAFVAAKIALVIGVIYAIGWAIHQVFLGIGKAFKFLGKLLWSGIKLYARAFVKFWSTILKAAISVFKGIASQLKMFWDGFVEALAGIRDFALDVGGSIKETFMAVFDYLGEKIGWVVDKVKWAVSNIPGMGDDESPEQAAARIKNVQGFSERMMNGEGIMMPDPVTGKFGFQAFADKAAATPGTANSSSSSQVDNSTVNVSVDAKNMSNPMDIANKIAKAVVKSQKNRQIASTFSTEGI